MKFCSLALVAGLAFGTFGSAHAYATYFGEDLNSSNSQPLLSTPEATAAQTSFLAAVTSLGTETFEGIATGTKAPLDLVFSGGLTATLSGSTGVVAEVTPGQTDSFGRYSIPAATTSKYWDVAAGPSGNFTVAFNRDVAGFGFFGVDIGDFQGKLQLQLLTSAGDTLNTLTVDNTVGLAGTTDGSVLYLGFIAQNAGEYFRSVRFLTSSGDSDVFAFDNFTVVERKDGPVVVPEPTSWALLGIGLLALGGVRLRKGRVRSRKSLDCGHAADPPIH